MSTTSSLASHLCAQRPTSTVQSLIPITADQADPPTAYDDGRTQLLLLVHGLLPITYRQASYHIPIAIWLTRDYPKEPPIAYVVPTADMLVKPGKYMDVSGRSSMEYLQNWARKSEVRLGCHPDLARSDGQSPQGCSLPALLDALQLLFSQDPPVYSKPKQSGPTQSRPEPVHHPRLRQTALLLPSRLPTRLRPHRARPRRPSPTVTAPRYHLSHPIRCRSPSCLPDPPDLTPPQRTALSQHPP
ncbi:hypothetical protein EVG20_g7825, partial [Dentipellis fragilis]